MKWFTTHWQGPWKLRAVILDSLAQQQEGLHHAAQSDRKIKMRRQWHQPQAKRPGGMSRKKWTVHMLKLARGGQLQPPPQPPDSEFDAGVRAPMCSVQHVQRLSDLECILNDELQHHVPLPVSQMVSQLGQEVQNEITDVD